MTATFRDGRAVRLWCNGKRLSRIFDEFEIGREVDTHETTIYEDNDKTYASGQRTGDISMGGVYDGSTELIQNVIQDALGSTTPQVWTAAILGPSIGSVAHLWESIQSAFDIASPAAGRVAVKGGSTPAAGVRSGLVLMNGTSAKTTTGAQTTTTGLAATTQGGVGHFHLTDHSTVSSITVKIQHSSLSAGTYTDLATFTTTGALTQQTSTFTGAVKRYVRSQISAFTGGAGKTVNVAVAFARKTGV